MKEVEMYVILCSLIPQCYLYLVTREAMEGSCSLSSTDEFVQQYAWGSSQDPVPQKIDWDSTLRETMFRRRIPFAQMAFATVLGVAGGVYIYRPYFEPLQKSSGQQNQDVSKNLSQSEENQSSLAENLEQAEARRST
ncbi:protein PIGBOS1 isoform X2 [Myripristis murdjan]|uniref:protein PIGBOS1 isoform X2 n=1 Tax=Myripristis murdjan TaxID=586833 RepID=UPI001175CE66|nr:protein PIGBOS1 isoform X2 [Myripristis murdjan]